MEMNQQEFAAALSQLKDTARLQENVLTNAQLEETLGGLWRDDAKQALIREYLNKNRIGVDTPWGASADAEEQLTGEDVNYLNMYLDELHELPTASDGEKRAIEMSALAGDATACGRLVELFLPRVVEIAKLYAGQGALVEDLVGEGNVAAAAGVTMLECVEQPEEIDGFLAKMVMDAMEEYISENADSGKTDEKVLERVNRVNDKSKELAETLMRKATVAEVAAELKLSEDEVRDAIRLSANHMEYIEDKQNAV